MARYIDADALIKKMFPVGLVGDGNYPVNARAVKYAIDHAPTAIDEIASASAKFILEEQEARYKALMAEHDREVAREIFEEIEKKVKSSITIHLEEINKEHIVDTPLYDRHSGILFALQGMEDTIAELKKKYTEVKDDG